MILTILTVWFVVSMALLLGLAVAARFASPRGNNSEVQTTESGYYGNMVAAKAAAAHHHAA